MIRILTFTSLFPNSQQPRKGIFVENRVRHLHASKEVEVVVVAPVPWFPFSFGPKKYVELSKVPVQEMRFGIKTHHPRYPAIPKIGKSITPLSMALSAISTFKNLIKQGYDFDIIDAHYFYPDGVAAVMIGSLLNKPVVITAHGTDINVLPNYYIPRKWMMWAAQKSTAMTPVCDALKQKMIKLGMNEKMIMVLRNGVDLNFFHPQNKEDIKRQLKISGKMLLSVGYLIELKGHHIVIDALTKLPDVSLCIAGNGELESQLKQQALERGVIDRVIFLGSIEPIELKKYMAAADALVLASSREGMALVLLEAIACGTPVVATKVGGTPEVITVPAAGVLIEQRNPESVVNGVKHLFAQNISSAATRNHAANFSLDSIRKEQLKIFKNVLAEQHSKKSC